MGIQLILCVEANKQSKTDYIYIKETIDQFYLLNPDIKITPLYMNGKRNYKSSKIQKELVSLEKQFSRHGNTKIIYCIDLDNYDNNVDDLRLNKQINEFCKNNGYDYIWFCKDIEEVYLKEKVENNQKVKKAIEFKRKAKTFLPRSDVLSTKSYQRYRSNILIVLDQYLQRK